MEIRQDVPKYAKKNRNTSLQKSMSILLIICMLFALVACTNNNATQSDESSSSLPAESNTPPVSASPSVSASPTPTQSVKTHESSIPLDLAAEYFDKVRAIWDEDDGKLWGVPLHAPLVFADTITRHLVADTQDPMGNLQRQGDVYVGVLPSSEDIYISAGNHSFWGLTWGMMPWDLVERASGETDIIEVLVHESFHAIQDIVVGEKGYTVLPPHMEQVDARISVMLELTALMTAIKASGDARKTAVHDALAIRYERRRQNPGADGPENHVEVIEGLADFTDMMLLGRSRAEMLEILEEMIEDAAGKRQGLVLFGYISGALYGLLLEDTGGDWKKGLTGKTDLGALLQTHMGISELSSFERVNLEAYGYSEIDRTQRVWMENYKTLEAGAENALNHMPTQKILSGDYFIEWETAQIEQFFIPHEHLDYDTLVFYGDFTVIGSYWRLEMHGGYMREVFEYQLNQLRRGIEIGSAIDIEVFDDGTRAANPFWELTLTSDNVMFKALPDGTVEIVRR